MPARRIAAGWKPAALMIVAVTALLFSSGEAAAAPGSHIWSQEFPGDSSESASGLAIDAAGNAFVAGSVRGYIDLGGGPMTGASYTSSDVFVAKFDPSGQHVWSKLFGDENLQVPEGVVADASGNLVVAGYFDGSVDFGGGALVSAGDHDVFLAKFDPDGNHVWSKRFGESDVQRALGIAIDSGDHVLIVGLLTGTVDFGGGTLTAAGTSAPFIAKFDASGNHVWSAEYGGAGSSAGRAIAVDSIDNVLVTGSFSSEVDFGGGALTTSSPYPDLFVAKLDSSGNEIWSTQVGDPSGEMGGQSGEFIAAGNSDDVLVAGASNIIPPDLSPGDVNVYIAKFESATGDEIWSKDLGDGEFQHPHSLMAHDGTYTLTGAFESIDFGAGPLTGASLYMETLDESGAHVWGAQFGDGVAGASVSHLAADPWGHLVAWGGMQGTIDFGGGPLASRIGSVDTFLMKLYGTSAPTDTDGDGCFDAEEVGQDILLGGRRDPDSPWDFYDVDGTKKVDSVDVGLVRSKFNQDFPAYDRSGGAQPWAPGPPDGIVNATDVGLVRASIFHSCQAVP